MAKRKRVKNKSRDKKYFSATARQTKKINIRPGQWRGGIML